MPVRGRSRAAHAPGAGPSTTLRYNPVEMVWGRNADEAQAADNPLSDRFTIRRRLGVGSFGIVYEALDKVNQTVVALKELISVDPASVSRFKSEFRTMADLHHPNLMVLHELLAAEGRWFYTMDLVRGTDFKSYVRPRRAPGFAGCDLGRLRPALAELAQAVAACHEAGYLHRDIKPSNILVRESGQLILMDFGLCSTTDALGNQASFHGSYAGTPAYSAPEIFRLEQPTRATDWFSVGVVMYEALLGQLPFTSFWLAGMRGDTRELLEHNLRDVPAELRDVCCALLSFDPSLRPGAEVLLAALGSGSERRSLPPARLPLIGRSAELATLERAWQVAQGGETLVVHVRGSSGIGKTTLVHHFLQHTLASDERGEYLVLEGRCFEHESVPYKALDLLLENLARQLRRVELPITECVEADHLEPLLRVFPCFRDPERGDEPSAPEADDTRRAALDLRERAFMGLADVFDALSRRFRVLLFLDDLQWADWDSGAALRSLISGQRRWRLLFIAGYRSGAENASEVVRWLGELSRHSRRRSREIELEPLSLDEAQRLVESIAPGTDAASVAQLYAEAGGFPYLLRELGQELASAPCEEAATDAREGPPPAPRAARSSSLNALILARLEKLPPVALEVLELVALAGRPLGLGLFTPDDEAAAESLPNALAQLKKMRLTRSDAARGSDHVDVYHDKIREAVLARLVPERRKALHEKLGMLLERSDASEVEELMHHFRASEDWARAQRYALLAAERATRALAFARAANLYELALGLPGVTPDAALLEALADALANSGRGLDAARAFQRAASLAPPPRRLALRRRAAEQFLRSGYIDEGREELATVLRGVGLRLSESSGAAFAQLLVQSARLRLRGLEFRPRGRALDQPLRDRIETCSAVGIGLGSVDLIHAFEFVLRHLRLALDSGDALSVARGLCLYASALATEGEKRAGAADALIRRAERLLEHGVDWHARGWVLTARSVLTWSLGNWAEAAALTEQALAAFTHCPAVAWEVAFLNVVRFESLYELGQLEALGRLVPPLLADTLNRGDLFAVTNVRTLFLSLLAVARDRPEEAWAEADEAARAWSKSGWHYQHWFGVYGRAHVSLYVGNGLDAHRQVEGCWGALSKSLILRHQLVRIHATYLRGRGALAAHAQLGQKALLADAARCARRLEGEGLGYARAFAALLRAGAAPEVAVARRHLERAMADFGALGMRVHEAAARWRWAELTGGAEAELAAGPTAEAEAEARAESETEAEAAWSEASAVFQAEGVVVPRRYVFMLAPGFHATIGAGAVTFAPEPRGT